MKGTKIEWADSTWNPVTGCRHGCEYCYARRIAERFGGCDEDWPPTKDENGNHYLKDYEKRYKRDSKGKRQAAAYPFGFEPTFFESRLTQPKKWHDPQNIFVCSTADLFGAWVPQDWIYKVYKAAKEAPQHRYLFLTKNPAGMMNFMDGDSQRSDKWWFGTTVTKPEDSFVWSSRNNTFISIEPIMADFPQDKDVLTDWVIIGAETGQRKEKIVPKPEWIGHITEVCDRNGIPVFMKDSLIPIIGEENMRREFPWETEAGKESGKTASKTVAQDALMPAT